MSVCRARVEWIRAAVGLALCVAAGVAWAQAENSSAGSGREGWEQLSLAETSFGEMKVFYEKVLEPNLPFFMREVTRLARSRDELAAVLAKHREIIADINRIVGVSDPNVDGQSGTFMDVGGMFSRTKLTLYFVTKPTTKDFLRSGGRLPHFQYDPQSDTATYNPGLSVQPGTRAPENWEFCVPVSPGEEFEISVSGVITGLDHFFGGGLADIAIHEVTEIALLNRVRPTDPYWRWFSDGFANAITHAVVDKHMGKDAARRFAEAYDPNDCRDREQQINLGYWMLGNFSVYTSHAPVEAESRIQQARYTYSMFEARRLIDRHGIDCVRKILDRVTAKDTRTSNDLLQAIQEVTGEDMEPRLMHYQRFATVEEGLREYASAFSAATSRQDYEQMFLNLLRIMELKGDTFTGGTIKMFFDAAMLLVRMGKEEAADQAMGTCVKLCRRMIPNRGTQVAHEVFISYALLSSKPGKAREAAEELLRLSPNHALALSIKMSIALQDGNLAQAKEYAVVVRDKAPEGSDPHKMALKILALDANTPTGYKESSEQR